MRKSALYFPIILVSAAFLALAFQFGAKDDSESSVSHADDTRSTQMAAKSSRSVDVPNVRRKSSPKIGKDQRARAAEMIARRSENGGVSPQLLERSGENSASTGGVRHGSTLQGQERAASSSKSTNVERERASSEGINSLAAQVLAHQRGRNKFMKQRSAELASHTPGCKCAYHAGHE